MKNQALFSSKVKSKKLKCRCLPWNSCILNTLLTFLLQTQYRYSNGDMSDTYFVVDVKYLNDTVTLGHNWHVHIHPITAGDCMSAGDHYNPFMVDMVSDIRT